MPKCAVCVKIYYISHASANTHVSQSKFLWRNSDASAWYFFSLVSVKRKQKKLHSNHFAKFDKFLKRNRDIWMANESIEFIWRFFGIFHWFIRRTVLLLFSSSSLPLLALFRWRVFSSCFYSRIQNRKFSIFVQCTLTFASLESPKTNAGCFCVSNPNVKYPVTKKLFALQNLAYFSQGEMYREILYGIFYFLTGSEWKKFRLQFADFFFFQRRPAKNGTSQVKFYGLLNAKFCFLETCKNWEIFTTQFLFVKNFLNLVWISLYTLLWNLKTK